MPKKPAPVKKRTVLAQAAPLLAAVLVAGCAGSDADGATTPTATALPSQSTKATPSPSASASSPSSDESVVGTVARFTAGDTSVDVTIGEDSPATRDFLGMLPMTLELEECNGREKIADLPRELEWEGSPGSDPEDGDLIYYVPWGNIGFYYDTDGIGYSDQTVHLGTYDATEAELARFEGQETTVEVVE